MNQRVSDEQAQAIKGDPDTLVVWTAETSDGDITASDLAADLLDARARITELEAVVRAGDDVLLRVVCDNLDDKARSCGDCDTCDAAAAYSLARAKVVFTAHSCDSPHCLICGEP